MFFIFGVHTVKRARYTADCTRYIAELAIVAAAVLARCGCMRQTDLILQKYSVVNSWR